jgi:uncharacterized protein DUF6650
MGPRSKAVGRWPPLPKEVSALWKRVRGVSVGMAGFSGGISLAPPEDNVAPIRALFVFLDDKRVLHASSLGDFVHDNRFDEMSRGQRVADSVIDIRKRITALLSDHDFDQDTRAVLQEMQRACRKLLDNMSDPKSGDAVARGSALGIFRLTFALAVEYLASLHGLTLDHDLRSLSLGAKNYLAQQRHWRSANLAPQDLWQLLHLR